MTKRILILAYSFPPASGSGVLRSLKFVKYLPSFNWSPIILTIKDKYVLKLDKELLKEIPDCATVIRTNVSNPLEWILNSRNKFRSILHKRIENQSETYNPVKPVRNTSPDINSLKSSFIDWLTFPDCTIGWVPWAFFQGIRIIWKFNPQIIYTTSPPVSTHIIGYYLKRLTRKPWIVDLRDPWDVEYSSKNKTNRRMKLELILKERILRSADRIIANTNALRDEICLSNPALDRGKVIVIPNGYDSDDFKDMDLKSRVNNGVCIISHIGELYPDGRRPDQFLKAVSELMKENKLSKNSLKIYFIGDRDITPSKEFTSLLENLGLNEVVVVKDHTSHKESIKHLFNSDILLLLQTGKRFRLQIPAKVYEYIAAQKPILTLTPNGETARFVNQYPLGTVVDPEATEQLKIEIQKMMLKRDNLPQNILTEFMSKYDRKKQTESLANVINTLVKSDDENN